MRITKGFSSMWADSLSIMSKSVFGGSEYKYQGWMNDLRVTLSPISIDYIKRK